MNLIVSGWPASGGSTTALLLCHMLGYKYVYAGSVLKYFAKRLGEGAFGDKLIDFENIIGESWDHVWEAYREWKLASGDKLLVEGKTAGFLQQDKSNVYCIMFSADLATRAIRAGTDGRDEDIEALRRRDADVGGRWQRLFGVDIYSMSEINKNYNLHIDSSKLKIEQVLEVIFNALSLQPYFAQNYFFPDLVKQIEAVVGKYYESGKAYFLDDLKTRSLLLQPEDVLREWNHYLPEQVERLHPILKTYVQNFN
jgi:cytidylate kinase